MTTSKYLTAAFLALIPIALSAAGYGLLLAGDSRYLRQDTWVSEKKSTEVRQLQYQIDELKWKQKKQGLSDKEQWQLQRLQSELSQVR